MAAMKRKPVSTNRPHPRPKIQLTLDYPKVTNGKINKTDFEKWWCEAIEALTPFADKHRARTCGGIHSSGFVKSPGKATLVSIWLFSQSSAASIVNHMRNKIKDPRYLILPPQSDYKKA